jgi:hypothetical protein
MRKAPDELNIVSIDPSLRSTGLFFCEEGKCRSETLAPKTDRLVTLGFYARYFVKLAKSKDWDLLLIENYSFGSKSNAVTVQAEVGGIIRACFAARGILIVEMPIQTWKAIAGIRLPKVSVKDKSDYKNAVMNKFDFTFDTTDEADAFMIFWAIREISRGRVKKGLGSDIRVRLEKVGVHL